MNDRLNTDIFGGLQKAVSLFQAEIFQNFFCDGVQTK